MPNICYTPKNFRPDTVKSINQANDIIAEYMADGYDLTLRQLYYQFVSRDLIPNTQRSYKNLGSIINDARMAGLIDWDSVVDRTRNLQARPHWESPGDIIDSAAYSYNVDLWKGQTYRPEVWIEKDALIGVIEKVCQRLDVPYFSCRGYTSQSEMWRAAQRLGDYYEEGSIPIIFHLGDHDPSGIDMSRDIEDRLHHFITTDLNALGYDLEESPLEVQRVALNRDQIDKYNPPPNPAKITDSRAVEYIRNHGDQSWELDALEPSVMSNLIKTHVGSLIEETQWKQSNKRESQGRDALKNAASRWSDIEAFLESK
jgi:hypothetical protein